MECGVVINKELKELKHYHNAVDSRFKDLEIPQMHKTSSKVNLILKMGNGDLLGNKKLRVSNKNLLKKSSRAVKVVPPEQDFCYLPDYDE
jgi:hypothetical protein